MRFASFIIAVVSFVVVALVVEGFTTMPSSSFVVQKTSRRRNNRSSASFLLPFEQSASSSGEESELQRLEEARAAFEELIAQTDFYNKEKENNQKKKRGLFNFWRKDNNNSGNRGKNDKKSLLHQSQTMVLTTTARRQREVEIELLRSLQDSDDAIDILMELWKTQVNDVRATNILEQMEVETSETGLYEEIEQLLDLRKKYPTWAEPYARLALAYYYKGRLDNARSFAQGALHFKPWHFEMTQLLIMCSLRDQNKAEAFRLARKHALPALQLPHADMLDESSNKRIKSFGTPSGRGKQQSPHNQKIPTARVNRRRQQWVERAVQQATEQLQKLEEASRRSLQSADHEEQQYRQKGLAARMEMPHHSLLDSLETALRSENNSTLSTTAGSEGAWE